jgi:acyl-CoA thioesterase-1
MRRAFRAYPEHSLAAMCRLACLIGLVGLASASVTSGCQSGETRETNPSDRRARAPIEVGAEHSEPDRPKIVALGDSLTAGLGLDVEEAYPAILQERIDEAGYSYQVVNAGVSGDTTAGGLSRVDWVLEGEVRVLILALGGNDGLRGLPAAEMKRNLAAIVERAQEKGAAVILAGMEAPPNMGSAYTSEFRQVFRDLAKEYDVAFLPFLLDGVAGDRELNQRDGIHPNAEGARRLADSIWPLLRPMLESSPAP